jgi:hypothetical protein
LLPLSFNEVVHHYPESNPQNKEFAITVPYWSIAKQTLRSEDEKSDGHSYGQTPPSTFHKWNVEGGLILTTQDVPNAASGRIP